MGAVIRYQVDGQSVSYYLMPDVASDNENQAVINKETKRGYNALIWRDKDLIHALVSTLPRARLQELAATCREAMRPASQTLSRIPG